MTCAVSGTMSNTIVHVSYDRALLMSGRKFVFLFFLILRLFRLGRYVRIPTVVVGILHLEENMWNGRRNDDSVIGR